jgi:hypothetical protein
MYYLDLALRAQFLFGYLTKIYHALNLYISGGKLGATSANALRCVVLWAI